MKVVCLHVYLTAIGVCQTPMRVGANDPANAIVPWLTETVMGVSVLIQIHGRPSSGSDGGTCGTVSVSFGHTVRPSEQLKNRDVCKCRRRQVCLLKL